MLLGWRCFAPALWSLLAACSGLSPSVIPTPARPMSCDDSVKSAYSPDGDTMVVAIRAIKKGDNLIAVDSPSPIKAWHPRDST